MSERRGKGESVEADGARRGRTCVGGAPRLSVRYPEMSLSFDGVEVGKVVHPGFEPGSLPPEGNRIGHYPNGLQMHRRDTETKRCRFILAPGTAHRINPVWVPQVGRSVPFCGSSNTTRYTSRSRPTHVPVNDRGSLVPRHPPPFVSNRGGESPDNRDVIHHTGRTRIRRVCTRKTIV